MNHLQSFISFTIKANQNTSKSMPMDRIVIYTSDIRLLTDKSESYARKEIQSLKRVLNKEKHQKVTIKEYCQYYGFNIDEVLAVLSKKDLKKTWG